MTLADRIERHRDVLQLLTLFLLLFVAHFVAFSTVKGQAVNDVFRHALAFAIPPIIVGWSVAIWLLPWLPKSHKQRFALLTPMAFVGSLLMYAMTSAILALEQTLNPAPSLIGISIEAAFVWQILQGMAYVFVAFLFGVICELDGALTAALEAAARPTSENAAKPKLNQILVRTDRGIVTVPVEEIICLNAADDYCDIVTSTKCHLAKMSLSECEQRLADWPFVRIHRSHMIHLSHLNGAEPAGNGRLQVTMSNGAQMISSRSGAQELRSVAV